MVRMATDNVNKFDSDTERDAQIRENTQRLDRHEVLALITAGYLIAEGNKLVTDLIGIL